MNFRSTPTDSRFLLAMTWQNYAPYFSDLESRKLDASIIDNDLPESRKKRASGAYYVGHKPARLPDISLSRTDTIADVGTILHNGRHTFDSETLKHAVDLMEEVIGEQEARLL